MRRGGKRISIKVDADARTDGPGWRLPSHHGPWFKFSWLISIAGVAA